LKGKGGHSNPSKGKGHHVSTKDNTRQFELEGKVSKGEKRTSRIVLRE